MPKTNTADMVACLKAIMPKTADISACMKAITS